VSVLDEIAAASAPALGGAARSGAGPLRFGAELGDRLFVLEAVYEGYLLHYGRPRLFEQIDEDLRLLAGDALYALGLSRLAQRGDLAAVAELCNLISLSAQAHAEGGGAEVEALWDASAAALESGAR
jgi:hypothetical protein